MKPNRTLGVILAGGASSRMGEEKALVPINGKPMIRHVFERLTPQVSRVAISGPEDFGLRVPAIPDLERDRTGPIAGIRAAGFWAERHFPDMKFLITVPVDAPFLDANLVEKLIKKTPSYATTKAWEHPTFANWGAEPHRLVESFSKSSSGKSLLALAEYAGAKKIEFSSEKSFLNINTQQDLTQI